MAEAAKKRALDLLTVLAAKPPSDLSTPTDAPPELSILHQDLISLLSLLYAACTKIALVLNPASPAYSASAEPLNDALKHKNGLIHCLSFYVSPTSSYGKTLGKEVSYAVRDVLDALSGLAETHSKLLRAGKPKKGDKSVDAERFLRVGAVHDLIEKAKGVSRDNLEAVRRRWIQDSALMEDSLRELQERIETRGECNEEEEAEWEELGLGGGGTLSEAAIANMTKVAEQVKKMIVRHKLKVLQKTEFTKPGVTPARLDELVSQSYQMVADIDELVTTVYVESDEDGEEELLALSEAMSRLELPSPDS